MPKITVVTAIKQPRYGQRTDKLCKEFTKSKATGDIKKKTNAIFAFGRFKVVDVDINGLIELRKSLTHSQALILGLPGQHQEGFIVRQDMIAKVKHDLIKHGKKENQGLPIIARKKNDPFFFPPKQPGFMLLDFDNVSKTIHEAIEIIEDIYPEFKKATFAAFPSSSNGLKHKVQSFHVMIPVNDASYIPRWIKLLDKRLWIAGYGHIVISNGVCPMMLKRCLIDSSVGSPERIIFAAPPIIRGFDLPQGKIIKREGEYLKINDVEDLTSAEIELYEDAVAEAKVAANPKYKQKIKEAAQKYAEKHKINEKDARQAIEDLKTGKIPLDMPLFFDGIEKSVTAAEVLKDWYKYDKKALADPNEPNYAGDKRTTAKFFWNNGNPIVHSFAHGGRKYTFVIEDTTQAIELGVLSSEVISALEKLNERYAYVTIGGKARYVMFDKNGVDFEVIQKDALIEANIHKRVDVAGKRMPLINLWRTWEKRRTYANIVFDPTMTHNDDFLNLFKGWQIEPKMGDCERILTHLKEIWCSGDEEQYNYVLQWLAHIFQDPGSKERPGTVLVLGSGQGTGKGIVLEKYLKPVLGDAMFITNSEEDIFGRFTTKLARSLVVGLDEAVWAGSAKYKDKFKNIITGDTLRFEPKGVDTMEVDSFLRIIVMTNSKHSVWREYDDRRFVCLDMSEKHKNDIEYFKEIYKEIKRGGPAAFLYYLLNNVKVDVDYLRSQIPETKAGALQKINSLGSIERFCLDVIDFCDVTLNALLKQYINIDDIMDSEENETWPEKINLMNFYATFVKYFNYVLRKRDNLPGQKTFVKTLKEFWPKYKKFHYSTSMWINGEKRTVRLTEMPSVEEFKYAVMKWLQIKEDDLI